MVVGEDNNGVSPRGRLSWHTAGLLIGLLRWHKEAAAMVSERLGVAAAAATTTMMFLGSCRRRFHGRLLRTAIFGDGGGAG